MKSPAHFAALAPLLWLFGPPALLAWLLPFLFGPVNEWLALAGLLGYFWLVGWLITRRHHRRLQRDDAYRRHFD